MFADESPEWNLDFNDSGACEECGETPALIHVIRVENGGVTHIRLCQNCADNLAGHTDGMALVLAVPTTFGRSSGTSREEGVRPRPILHGAETPVCTVCGTTLADFKESGMLGCSVCYQVFADQLKELAEEDGELPAHLGKVPQHASESDLRRREVMRLERMLRELVDHERYEEAAGVRDRLAELSPGTSGGS